MAILTDSIIDVGNYITFNIGLSKSISNYTADEVWNSPYCASSWDAYRHICDESFQGVAPGSIESSEFQMPFHFTGFNQMYVPATYNFEEGQIEYNQGDTGIYGKIIWLCETGDTSIAHIFGKQRCITNTDGVKIVTQMDMTQVYLYLNTFESPADHDVMFLDYDNFKIKENHDGVTSYEHPRNCSIFPAVMFMYNNKLYIHRIFQNSYTSLDWSWWLSYYGDSDHGGHTELQGHTFNAQPVSFDNTKTAYLPINIMRQFSGLRPTNTERFFTMSDIEEVGVRYQWLYGYDGGRICPATVQKYLQMASWYGCKFYHSGTYYKPIIENGFVTGYTDNMSTPSELDNYTGAMSHNVPPAPPSGGSGDNIETDMPLAYIGGTAGFVQFIKINSSGLASADDISAALSRFDITTIGKDLLRNFISFKCFAVLNIDPNNQVTRQITVDGHGLTDSGGNPLNGQVIGGLLPVDFTAGTIPHYYNDYRDYAPYTKIEMYVPFCGWFSLPSWVIGKKITGTMFTDLYNGTVKAVIYASRTVVAEVGGCCAYDIPFVADATGAKAGAVISSALTTAAATAGTIAMPNVATGITALSAAANTISAANSNDTTLKGVLGDGSNLNGLLHVYLKVTRPESPTGDKDIPATYKHEYGIPCYKQLNLTAGDGYTQIMDANIEGAMTDREKQMIIDGFRHGLIL